MATVASSLPLFICWSIGLFLLGGCIGGFIVYKIEEKEFNAMMAQCETLAVEEEKLRREREDLNNRRKLDTIYDLPEYLRDKYDIQEKPGFAESDEDLPEIYV